MALRITADVFSGRPNPSFIVAGNEFEEIVARVAQMGPEASADASGSALPRLGYRGLDRRTGRQPNAPRGTGRPSESRTRVTSMISCSNTEPVVAADGLASAPLGSYLAQEVARTRAEAVQPPAAALDEAVAAAGLVTAIGCERAPINEPDWWNDGQIRQLNNNCYNYATNHRTDSYAQPGRSASLPITAYIGRVIKALAMEDGLIDAPNHANACPAEGHLVALVAAPGADFHWYRKERNGFWAHKAGFLPVTSLDNAGRLITDPRSADRGPYSDFVGFMVVRHGHIKLL